MIGPSRVTRWSYAISKLFDEQLVFAYGDRYDLPFSIVRYFSGYGPGQHPSWLGGPQSVFIDAALEGKSMTIHGDGLQTRSFIYISDLVEATMRVLRSESCLGNVVNIGTSDEISIKDLAGLIWEIVTGNKEIPFQFIPYSDLSRGYEDVMRRVPDLSKLKAFCDFEPTVSLKEGLKKTVAWRQQQVEMRGAL